jgi:LPXTG-site transpeptidase (sortase) family protein
MNSNDNDKSAAFDASLPLPSSDSNAAKKPDDQNLAAELIRKKVAAAYAREPDIEVEEENLEEIGSEIKRSKHQQFIYDLTSTGKALHDIQTAWHEYYLGLTDLEKHQVWQEFYSTQSQAAHHSGLVPSMAPAADEGARKAATKKQSPAASPASLEEIRRAAVKKFRGRPQLSAKDSLRSLAFGLGIGCIVLLILLFSFFNERFIAPFIQPSRHVNNIPLISAGAPVSDKSEVIIPKINVEIPVVYGVDTVSESAVDTALESGVVHYADTAMPGQNGNLVIVGHSSNNIFNPGKYKFAFVLLSKLENGDTFYIQKDGKRYTYQVYQKKIVSPSDVSVLGPGDKPAIATLITCDPPGTSINRLVVLAEQISPDPVANIAANDGNTVATTAKQIPGNSPSLWSRIWNF